MNQTRHLSITGFETHEDEFKETCGLCFRQALWHHLMSGHIQPNPNHRIAYIRKQMQVCLDPICRAAQCLRLSVGKEDHIYVEVCHEFRRKITKAQSSIYEGMYSDLNEVGIIEEANSMKDNKSDETYDAINPPHYRRGPRIELPSGIVPEGKQVYTVECIEVMRHIKDPRLATAFKYIWRVAFGGKNDPNHGGNQESVNARDIGSAKWYLEDYLKNPPQEL